MAPAAFTMTEDVRIWALPLADRLRIAAVDLTVTRAPRAPVSAVWLAERRLGCGGGGHLRPWHSTCLPQLKRAAFVVQPQNGGALMPSLPSSTASGVQQELGQR